MIFRNALKSNLRAKGRTILFTALIIALTAMITLSLGVRVYCAGAVSNGDGSFRTIGVIEYLGAEYPLDTVGDPAARDAAKALESFDFGSVDGVNGWLPASSVYAYLDGYENAESDSIYRDFGVIKPFFIMNTRVGTSFIECDPPADDEPCIIFNHFIDGEVYWYDSVTIRLEGREDIVYDSYFGVDEVVGWQPRTQYYLVRDIYNAPYPYDGVASYTEKTLPDMCIYSDWYSTTKVKAPDDSYYDPVRNDMELPVYRCFEDTGKYMREEQVVQAYTAIADVMYGFEYSGGQMVEINALDGQIKLEDGKAYYIHGRFSPTYSGAVGFTPCEFGDSDRSPYAEANGEDDAELYEFFSSYARKYKGANSHVNVVECDDIGDLLPFHQGFVGIAEGRLPAPGEKDVCVLSYNIAANLELKPGDEITLRDLVSSPVVRADVTDIKEGRTLKVVGITFSNPEYNDTVWTPRGGADHTLYGYELGTVQFDNAKGRAAAGKIAGALPDNTRLTIYDQGYESAIKPFLAIENTAKTVFYASLAGAVAALLLFGYLFIGRQSETVGILHALGTPKRKIAAWMLTGSTVISAVSAILGAALGRLLIPKLIEIVREKAAENYVEIPAYSELSMGVVKRVDLSGPDVEIKWFILSAAAVVVAALIFSLVFLARAVRGSHNRRGKTSVRIPAGKTSVFGGGAFRFAVLSARRGGLRTFAVPAVAAVMTVIIVVLSAVTGSWQRELERAYDETEIAGAVTSTSGKRLTGLLVRSGEARAIAKTPGVSHVALSKDFHYWLDDEMPEFSGSAFGMELRKSWIFSQPNLIMLNDLSVASEFYYTPAVTTWLDGWDESFLALDGKKDHDADYIPALAPDSFAASHGIGLSDEITVNYYYNEPMRMAEPSAKLLIVGTYRQTGVRDHIYVPLYVYGSPSEIFEGDDSGTVTVESYNYKTGEVELVEVPAPEKTFSACRFKLDSARHLDDLRDAFREAGYSWPNHRGEQRFCVVIYDAAFLDRVEALERSTELGAAVYPMVFALVALLGFVVSWLMINGRKQEFAYMRGFGAKRVRVFMSFFIEQTLLLFAGCAVGAISVFFAGGDGETALRVGAFLLCYMAGCALSVLLIGRMKLMDLLSERD